MLPIDPVAVTILLLVTGVVASFVPLVPGGAVSTLGIAYYWAATGEPGTVAFLGFVGLGVSTVIFDLLGDAISARVGGASTLTTIVAAVVAAVLMFVLGPLGALLGVVVVVLLLEYIRHRDIRRGIRTATITAIGMLASTAMQVLLTISMLVGFLSLLWL
jgi:uncharacterized protein YqgC (DUF456 family)